MRPFRFFFVASLGLLLFLFFARFVITALLLAAAISTVFYFGRRIRRFFSRMDWREEDQYYRYGRGVKAPVWKDELLLEYPSRPMELKKNVRTIKVQ